MKSLFRTLVLLAAFVVPMGLTGCTGEAEPGGPDEEVPFDQMGRDTFEVTPPATDTLVVDTTAADGEGAGS